MEKTMKARVQHKHDVEANWLKATNFTPLASEIIVYDPDENYDYPRIKIGDGKTNINSLPFVTKDYAKISDIPTKPEDIGALPDSTVIPTVPTKISAFENDKGYLTEHQDISHKLDASALPTAINTALEQAKESGEFDGTSVTVMGVINSNEDGGSNVVTFSDGKTLTVKNGSKGSSGYTPIKGKDYFDGKDGLPGVDGKDGYTPQKGIDYFDGQDGSNGVSATHSWNGTVLTVTSASGTSSADLKGEKGDKGDKGDAGAQGEPGKDGVSATHSWNGTVLTVSSASGSSYADLKGAKGDKGDKGDSIKGDKGDKGDTGATGATGQRGTGLLAVTTAPSSYTTEVGGITPKYRMSISTIKTQSGVTEVLLGDTVRYSYYHYPIAYLDASYAYFTTRVSIRGATGAAGAAGTNGADGMPGAPGAKGEDGYTPVKGVDYYTASDKAEWSTYIASELAKRGQLKPEFANSISECTDTTKLYVLPDGFIYAYMLTEVETGPSYKNWLTYSVNQDGSDYKGDNGEDGYRKGYRWSASSKAEKAATNYDCVGYIQVKANDIIRIANVGNISPSTDGSNYATAYFYNSSFEQQYGAIYLSNTDNQLISVENGVYTFAVTNSSSTINWMKLTLMGVTADTIITINEEITEGGGTTTGYAWASTGRAFVPADYEGRIVNLEKETTDLRKLINSGSSNNTESGSTYTNVLPSATKGSDQATGWVEGKGYTQTARLSGSSGTVTTNYTVVEGVCVSGYIPVTEGDIVRIKGFYPPDGVNAYVVAYNGTSPTGYKQFATVTNITTDGSWEWNDDTGGWYSIDKKKPLTEVTATIQMSSANFGSGFNAIRFSGVFSEEVIVTINEKISTGNTSNGGTPSETLEESLDRIKNWKYPIHEDAPVFLLENDKPAISSSEQTTEAVYAKYDALMNANPGFITKVNCGMASDGSTPIYVYHFKEAEPHYSSPLWSETKPVLLICSGVHPTEQSGVHSLFHAMEEITTNSKLRDLRRNVHFIVMPMINPTAFTDTSYGVRNPDGIQVHYNFEVDFKYPSDSGYVANGNRNHGGETPLSIPETQYFDALMNEYKENLALVISCHNNDVDEQYGTGFIWCSCATHFMCNLGFRFVDKMSAAWREKYGTAFDEGVRWANEYALAQAEAGSSLFNSAYTKEQPEWDYRVGRASISGSGGTEYKQALKYGVHGINVEVCDRCMILDKDFGKKRTANVVTMGTETYINFFRTFMAIYDPKNKKDYAPNLPRK